MPDPLVCPACDGPKSRRAKLCRPCRLRANGIGEQVWTETHTAPLPSRPRTPQQNTVFHARCTELATTPGATKEEIRQRKRAIEVEVKAWASKRFGREIESSTQLTEIEMELVLEHLDDLLTAVA